MSEVVDGGGHGQVLVDACGGWSGVGLVPFPEGGPRDGEIHLDGEYRVLESIERIE